MLPKCINEWIISTLRPKTRNTKEAKNIINEYKNEYGFAKDDIEKLIISNDEAIKILDEMGVRKDTTFYEFYGLYSGVDSSENEEADLMYSLDEIYEDYKQPFWSRYKEIGERYLQLSSIEGEWSYFYDKQTEAVYGVDWAEMDEFVAGNLEPLFTTFYDFLEWYYSDSEEE